MLIVTTRVTYVYPNMLRDLGIANRDATPDDVGLIRKTLDDMFSNITCTEVDPDFLN